MVAIQFVTVRFLLSTYTVSGDWLWDLHRVSSSATSPLGLIQAPDDQERTSHSRNPSGRKLTNWLRFVLPKSKRPSAVAIR